MILSLLNYKLALRLKYIPTYISLENYSIKKGQEINKPFLKSDDRHNSYINNIIKL